MHDIERIIELVRARLPDIDVEQLQVKFPADDDGVWWFKLPGVQADVQLDSSSGQCPFLVDTSDSKSPMEAVTLDSVDDIAERIVRFLQCKRG
jgi:hypothetical protein